jgi:hypothetical protein
MKSPRLVYLADPAAGTNLIYTQPATLMSKVIGCRFTYTASAVVANRAMIVCSYTGALVMSAIRFTQVTTAGLIRMYCAQDSYSQAEALVTLGGQLYVIREAGGFWLTPGMILRTNVENIQAADQISGIVIELDDVNLDAPGALG